MNTPLAYTIAEAVAVSRISRTAIYRAISEGHLPARKRGARTLILASDLADLLTSLPVVKPRAKVEGS